MPRVFKSLVLLLALALFGAACSGGGGLEAQTATDPVDPTPIEVPEQLAAVDIDEDTVPADMPEADGTNSDPAMQDKVEDGDDDHHAANNERIGGHPDEEDDAMGEGPATDAPSRSPLPDGVDEDTASCVDDALQSDQALAARWNELLDSSGAGAGDADSNAMLEPILECLTFGEAVAMAVQNSAGVSLSSDTVDCINNDIGGAEDDLLEIIAGPTAADPALVNALTSCVSEDELVLLMASGR